jgi:regulator of sigma E protease
VSKAEGGSTLSLTVSRAGVEQTFNISVPQKATVADSLVGYPKLDPVVDDVAIGFPAEKAGLKSGDLITAIDGKPVATWYQLVNAVHASEGRPINFKVRRDGDEIPILITPMQGMGSDGQSVWQIGVSPRTHDGFEREGPVTAAKDAGVETYLSMRQIVQVVAGLFNGKVSIRELQGVVGIARVSGQAAQRGPMTLLGLMAVISLNLGLLNLFPIPVLDGGHVLLLAIEGLLRRDLSITVKERFVQVGLVFLLGIFAFVMYSDILKLIQSH